MLRCAMRSMLFLPVLVGMLVFIASVYADEGFHLLGSDGEPIRFPFYAKNISSKLAEKAVSEAELDKIYPELDLPEEERKEGKGSRLAYPSSVLEELKNAIEMLPQAARTVNGVELHEYQLNGKTIYVNSKVHAALSEAGLLPGDTPRDSATLFQLLDAACEYKIHPLCNVYAHKIAGRINQTTYDQISKLKKDRYWKHQSEEDIFRKAVENSLLAIEESLLEYQHDFPTMDCTRNQQWIEKYVMMFLHGVKNEYTFADYMGLHGQGSWRSGRIDLRNSGLTSLEGLELITNPTHITEMDVSDNEILTTQLMRSRAKRDGTIQEVDLTGQRLSFAFSRLTHLKSLNLSNNKMTSLPDKLFSHNPLHTLILDNNQLTHLSEEMCQGFNHLKELSFVGNPMTEEVIAEIGRHLPKSVQESAGSAEKKKKKEKKDKAMVKTKAKSKSAHR